MTHAKSFETRQSYILRPLGRRVLSTGEILICDVPECTVMAIRFERSSKVLRHYGGPTIHKRRPKKVCGRHYSERVCKRLDITYPD